MNSYLECATLEGFHEVLGLSAKNGLVKFEEQWSAGDRTIGEHFGVIKPGGEVSREVGDSASAVLTSQSLLSVQSRSPRLRP